MQAKTGDAAADTFRLGEFLPYRLAVAMSQITRVFSESFGSRFNLSIPEWRVLAVVAEQGPVSPTTVVHSTNMDKVKVSRAAQSLVAKGILRQRQDPRDGRGRLLQVTRKGATTAAAVVPVARDIGTSLFEGLNRADLAALDRILAKIAARVETIEEQGPA